MPFFLKISEIVMLFSLANFMDTVFTVLRCVGILILTLHKGFRFCLDVNIQSTRLWNERPKERKLLKEAGGVLGHGKRA